MFYYSKVKILKSVVSNKKVIESIRLKVIFKIESVRLNPIQGGCENLHTPT